MSAWAWRYERTSRVPGARRSERTSLGHWVWRGCARAGPAAISGRERPNVGATLSAGALDGERVALCACAGPGRALARALRPGLRLVCVRRF